MILKNYLVWPNKMAIFVVRNSLNYDRWFSISSFWIFTVCTFVIELINGMSMVLCTWVVIIGLVYTICGVPTTLIFTAGSPKLLFKFLLIENPPNPWLKFTTDLITIPLMATCVLGTTTISTPMVVMTTLSDWITFILIAYLWFLTTTASNTVCEVVLVQIWWYSIMWLPIGSLRGAECGCEYTFGSLLLNWMDGWIYWLYGPNWLPNSMSFSLFWTTWILGSYSCGWSINAPATFCNSTCLAICVLMWKSTKGQSIIACPSSSQITQTFESNLTTSESTYSWSCVSTMYIVCCNYRFPWCKYDCGTSSNAFTYAFAYWYDRR